jgi:hypothetical protein
LQRTPGLPSVAEEATVSVEFAPLEGRDLHVPLKSTLARSTVRHD